MKKLLACLGFFLIFGVSFADKSSQLTANHSKQLLIVTTTSWDSSKGELQRYQRDKTNKNWQAYGEPMPVILGKKGLAAMGVKKDGDLKTPSGIFSLGSAFGFAPQYIKNIKMPYTQLTATTVCVDDPNSKYYNRIVNRKKISHPDWKSGEMMRQNPEYMWGIVINYNTVKPVAGAGSCNSLHVWNSAAQTATPGSVSTNETDIEELVTWLNPKKKPMIAILPKNHYQQVQATWGLPNLK